MFNEFEKEEDSWRPPQKRWWVLTKKILSYALISFIVLFIAFLIFRSIESQPPKSMTEFIWTDSSLQAYNTSNGDGSFKVISISSSQSFDQGDGDDDKTDDTKTPMVSIYSTYYTPSTSELQFAVRYNNRLFDYLFEAYPQMQELYDDDKEMYVYTLRYEYADEEYTVTDYTSSSAKKGGYTYKKMFFELDPTHKLEDVSIMELEIACVAEPSNVRHVLYIFKSGFGMLEYDYDDPGSAIPKDKTAAYAIPLCFILMAAAGIICSLKKIRLVLMIAPAALISLLFSLFMTEFWATLIVLAVAYAFFALLPVIKSLLNKKEENN